MCKTLSTIMAVSTLVTFVTVCASGSGYRPASDLNSDKLFLDRLGNIEMTIFPTVVRSSSRTTHDESSRERIGAFLEENKIAKARYSNQRIDVSESTAKIQWRLFQESMSLFANHLKSNPIDTKYAMMVEYLVTPRRSGGEAIGGIQCYVLDADGGNVFSFLLNSHHKLFIEGGLKTDNITAEGRAQLVKRGTDVVIEALRHQLDRTCVEKVKE